MSERTTKSRELTLVRTNWTSASPAASQAGLTLIELMVSILLASILTAGLFYMMSGQQKTYTAQLNNMTSQENLWGSMEYLQGQIRRAGFGFAGCNGEVRAWRDSISADIIFTAMTIRNGFSLYTNATDPQGSDSFSVLYSSEANGGLMGVKIVQRMPSSSAILKINAPGTIQDNDLLVIWKPGSDLWCSLMQATQNPQCEASCQRYHVQHSHGGGKEYNPPGGHNIFPPGGYPVGSVVMKLGDNGEPRKFAIDHGRNPPQLVTWVATDKSDLEVVGDNIEDMQLSWACDMNSDGVFNEGRTDAERRNNALDEWVNNVSADNPPTCQLPLGCVSPNCTRVPIGLVRVTLIARAASPFPGDRQGFRPAAEDQAAGTVADDLTATGGVGTYSRAVLTSTVMPRNIRRSHKP